MALIQCTKKLLSNIKNCDEQVDAGSPTTLGNWHANLIVLDRRKCVLFMNDKTLYLMLVPGLLKADFQNLRKVFLGHLALNLKHEGLGHRLGPILAEYQNGLEFTTTGNRRVLGSMNDMHRLIPFFLDGCGNIEEFNHKLNGVPFSLINSSPLKCLHEHLNEKFTGRR